MELEPTAPRVPVPGARGALATTQSEHRSLVVVATSLVAAVALAATLARVNDGWIIAAFLAAFPVLVAVVVIDSRSHRIPTALVTIVATTIAFKLVGSAITAGSAESLVRSLVASAAVGAVYLVLNRVADIGLGDVRLAAVLGVIAGYFSWTTVLAFVVAAHFAAVPEALWHLVWRDARWMALSPAIVTGSYLAVWFTAAR